MEEEPPLTQASPNISFDLIPHCWPSFNLKLLEKVHKNEENGGESIEHITRTILHLAQDRKLSEMAKV